MCIKFQLCKARNSRNLFYNIRRLNLTVTYLKRMKTPNVLAKRSNVFDRMSLAKKAK